jgi:hypothetical protein
MTSPCYVLYASARIPDGDETLPSLDHRKMIDLRVPLTWRPSQLKFYLTSDLKICIKIGATPARYTFFLFLSNSSLSFHTNNNLFHSLYNIR